MYKDYHDFTMYLKNEPNERGYFGTYGGAYVSNDLQIALQEINNSYLAICNSREFISELRRIRKEYQGRPTPITHCKNLSNLFGNVQIYLKREDLNFTGAHKLNHCMGEGLLAKFMGKKKLICETGAGQHGVALATAAAYFGMQCDVYMGAVDIVKQQPNVRKMRILGANVISCNKGQATLKEAVDAAFSAYISDYKNSIYCIGSVVGPHPFPRVVRDFQSIIGIEAKEQFYEMTGNNPDAVCACVGGGSNAIGIFSGFLDQAVELYGIEPLGRSNKLGDHAATLTYGEEGVMHAFKSMVLKDNNGNPAPVYSCASGLDYPSVGPEHSYLKDLGRVKYVGINDKDALKAFYLLSRNEGVIPAIESSHALAFALKYAKKHKQGTILVNLSGRGDKDLDYICDNYGYEEK